MNRIVNDNGYHLQVIFNCVLQNFLMAVPILGRLHPALAYDFDVALCGHGIIFIF